MLRNAIIVGIGGFAGSAARYLLAGTVSRYCNTDFPLGTIIVNLAGCFFIGIILGVFEKGGVVSSDMRLFLTVGFCGGFTTFSSFTSDTVNLANDSDMVNLGLYLGLSVIAGIYMTIAGRSLVNYFSNVL